MRSRWLAIQFLITLSIRLAAQPSTVPLRVQVVDGRDGKPFPNVKLSLSDLSYSVCYGPVKPDESGVYNFRVKPEDYILSAENLDSGHVYHGQLPDGKIELVRVPQDSSGISVVFPFFPRGNFSGFVRDELGEPIRGV